MKVGHLYGPIKPLLQPTKNTIAAGTYFKRSTGKTGQVIASPEFEAKLLKVEALYREYHGVPMGRGKFYDMVLEPTRETKADAGGYIQYTAEAVAGIILDKVHKALGQAVRRKNRKPISIEIGSFTINNLRDLARSGRGPARKKVA